MSKISLLVKTILSKAKISSFPIPVNKIASANGVVIKLSDLEDDISGFLYMKETKPIIFVNSDHSNARRRFTIAHELGHLFLNHSGELFVDKGHIMYRNSQSKEGNIKQEREANKFAAELLMPEEMLINELLNSEIDIEDSEKLNKFADKLGVSTQALSIRLSNLGWNWF